MSILFLKKYDKMLNNAKIPEAVPRGNFYSAATAAAVVIGASATGVAGKRENYEDRDDDPDKAFVVVEKTAKAVVIHGIPPKNFD